MLFRYRRSHIYLYLIYHISAEIMHRDPELVRSNGVQGVTENDPENVEYFSLQSSRLDCSKL